MFPIEKGDAFLIRPYQQVYYQADEQQPYSYYWVGFNGTEVENLLEICGYAEENHVLQIKDEEVLTDTMSRIASIHFITSSENLRLISLLYQLFSILARNNESQLNRSYNNYFRTAVNYIRRYLPNDDLSVQQIAALVGIDRSHLYRVFRTSCGMSVQQFILSMRVKKAKELLAMTSYGVSDIAAACGVSDPSYFSQLFRRVEGVSPREYRILGNQYPSESEI